MRVEKKQENLGGAAERLVEKQENLGGAAERLVEKGVVVEYRGVLSGLVLSDNLSS